MSHTGKEVADELLDVIDSLYYAASLLKAIGCHALADKAIEHAKGLEALRAELPGARRKVALS